MTVDSPGESPGQSDRSGFGPVRVVRVGFIGVGGVAQVHLRALEGMSNVRIAAVSDVSVEAAQTAARRFEDCRAYDDHQAMLDGVELDAVYVCLPPGAHRGQEIDVARRGLALFVEKPVGLDLAWVRETADVVARNGLLTSVGYNWRYLESTELARATLADRPVGLAMGFWLGGLPGTPWWRLRAHSGGQVVEQATHIFDLCRYLIGEVSTVFAGASRGQFQELAGYDIDDASACTLLFKNGTVGTIVATDLAPRGYSNIGLHLISRDLTVEITPTRLRVSRPGRVEDVVATGNAYQAEDRAFVQAVAGGDRTRIRSDYADAVRTLELTLAAARSMESEQAVRLED
ncbi:MAG TPA: Gfo/Idh/MocA family oxidoreductase [Chloroflexota bacterium]|jgi:predicted dehydrogenase